MESLHQNLPFVPDQRNGLHGQQILVIEFCRIFYITFYFKISCYMKRNAELCCVIQNYSVCDRN